jgi:hypothetical protein
LIGAVWSEVRVEHAPSFSDLRLELALQLMHDAVELFLHLVLFLDPLKFIQAAGLGHWPWRSLAGLLK